MDFSSPVEGWIGTHMRRSFDCSKFVLKIFVESRQ